MTERGINKVLSEPHKLLVEQAGAVKEALLVSLERGVREDFPKQMDLLARYQALIAAADYIVGYDGEPRFRFVIEENRK